MNITQEILARWRSYRNDRRERAQYYRTAKAIRDLPPHIMKDIGWPGAYEPGVSRR